MEYWVKKCMTQKQILEYIWLDGMGKLRSKTRVLQFNPEYLVDPSTIPLWDYDGSSCGHPEITSQNSEVRIIPRKVIKCPFRRDMNLLVLCDGYTDKGDPLLSNTRYGAALIFSQKPELKSWFGLEQEFFLKDALTGEILAFSNGMANVRSKQGQYYCSVGPNNAICRSLMEETLQNFIYADLTVSGMNAEVAPSQWEYQIGPCEGLDSPDQHYLSRYILERTAEKYNIIIEYHPKPLLGDWNGSGCHTNFSTLPMREDGGIKVIEEAITKLGLKRPEHMAVYGEHNELRLTGKHETADMNTFTFGRGNRAASVRVNNSVYEAGKGYLEDRSPNSACDPYLVTSIIFKTCCLD